jgi:hypothetical protein
MNRDDKHLVSPLSGRAAGRGMVFRGRVAVRDRSPVAHGLVDRKADAARRFPDRALSWALVAGFFVAGLVRAAV